MTKNRSRGRSLKLNILTGLLQEVVALICGLILPKLILARFGSEYNGVVNSIAQFLSFSVILRSGLGAVTNAALYRPLAEGNVAKVSGIMVATDRFMRKVAGLLGVLILGFALIYPLMIEEFHYGFTFWLVVITGISTFAENMVSVKYKIILQADQKYYIQTFAAIIAQILSTVISVILIQSGSGIHLTRLGAAVGLLTTPVFLKVYVHKHYDIDWTAPADDIALQSRWDAFAQQLSLIVNNNVPTIIMTLMLPIKEVSVYSVYNMVVHNIRGLMANSIGGTVAAFGNMLARCEYDHLRKRFGNVEFLIFSGTTLIYTTTAVLLMPFVLVYTRGIADAQYDRQWLGYVMVLASALTILRLPYQMMSEAAGHFRQTRNGAIWEVVLHIVLSAVLAGTYGVTGVALGAFLSSLVRTVQLAWYANRRILHLTMRYTIKNFIAFPAGGILIARGLPYFIDLNCSNYWEWFLSAFAVFCFASLTVAVLSVVFCPVQSANIVRDFIMRKRMRK